MICSNHSEKSYFKCEVCLAPMCDCDLASNRSDHPHDGYWCGACLTAYSLPKDEGLALLRTRLHSLSQLSVKVAA